MFLQKSSAKLDLMLVFSKLVPGQSRDNPQMSFSMACPRCLDDIWKVNFTN